MEFTYYLLPDGRTVPVDATAANGAAVIDYMLSNGEVVDAHLTIRPASNVIDLVAALRASIARVEALKGKA